MTDATVRERRRRRAKSVRRLPRCARTRSRGVPLGANLTGSTRAGRDYSCRTSATRVVFLS